MLKNETTHGKVSSGELDVDALLAAIANLKPKEAMVYPTEINHNENAQVAEMIGKSVKLTGGSPLFGIPIYEMERLPKGQAVMLMSDGSTVVIWPDGKTARIQGMKLRITDRIRMTGDN